MTEYMKIDVKLLELNMKRFRLIYEKIMKGRNKNKLINSQLDFLDNHGGRGTHGPKNKSNID